MDVTDQSALSAPPTRPQLTKTPIAHLSPTLEHPEDKCIYATVSLVWPYSSSTKSLALLLAEPDFRLRRPNGQVKAVFHGRVAETVAEQHIGIGETVCLSLKDPSFVPNDAASQTPGRSIAWDLCFERGLTLEVDRSSQNLPSVRIEVELPAPHEAEPPSTPRLISNDSDTVLAPTRESWGSPAFHKSSRRSSGSAVDFAFDPFTEEDGFVPGKGRKRPRYSLQRTEWRVVDEPESPEEREEPMDWEKALEDEIDAESDTEKSADIEPAEDASVPVTSDTVNQANVEDPFQDESAVFVKPSLDLAGGLFGRRAPQTVDSGPTTSAPQSPFGNLFRRPTDTPQLRPIPSPGLPIPSPLISNQGNQQEYFAPFHIAPSAHDVDHASTSDPNTAVQELDSLAQAAQETEFHEMPDPTEQPQAVHDDETLGHPPPLSNSHQALDSVLGGSPVGAADQLLTVDLDQFHSHTAVNESNLIGTDTRVEIVEELHMTISTEQFDAQPLNEAKDEALQDDFEAHGTPDLEVGEQEVEGSQGTSPPLVPMEMPLDEAEPDEDMAEDTADEDEDQGLSELAGDDALTQNGSVSANQSDAEDEVRYEEDAEGEYYSENELYDEEEAIESWYEDESHADESEDEDNEAAGRSPAQPEIIVLDSDSEDESASAQPTATSPHHARQQSVSSEAPQSSAEDEREDWSVVEDDSDHIVLEDQDSGDYESENEYEGERHNRVDDKDDRVHDSDMEDDEPSADDLAQDDYSEERSSRDGSVEEEPDGEEHLQPITETEDAAVVEGKLETFTEVEVHEVQPGQGIDMSISAEEPPPHDPAGEQRHPTTHDEERPSGRKLKAFMTVDGAHDWPEVTKTPEENHETPFADGTPGIEKEKEISDTQEDTLESDVPAEQHPNKGLSFDASAFDPTEQQLPTPDPTQEVLPGDKSAPNNEQEEELAVAGELASPGDLDISLATAPEELIAPGQQNDANNADVVLPTTELTDDRQQDDEQDIAAPELTVEAPKTPVVVISKPPVPDRDAHGLRSKLSYFAPLATLADHYNALVDTISVVYEASPVAKATSGSKEYSMTIFLTDPSMAGTTLEAKIFRRYKSAMPSVAEGQAILLRDFKVQSHNHSMTLVSLESSSWAVFDGSGPEAKMTGPPVEYGSEELAFASGLRRWYSEAGAGMVADSQLQASIKRDSRSFTPSSVAASDAGSLDETPSARDSPSARGSRRSRRSHRRVTIHELRDGTRYTEVGSPSGQHGIHELRDGTVYANE
ncbi:uncharacterized protein N7496_003887 [Penicillium cataractarum]|uniref:Telomeric single stranded DNA binding POT1/Cdc13 domain-containing protein n=1 Tax=Penicillium cataractarum TaxID=2100454 RepID=A0A9W9VHZ4_9EURO|nr:uncharacterized protein N7496_003887 [Penicillium cataractarum]KAJ5381459.1 hypothetical protein N7496_003887 [Penicillium cataractarum]